MPTVLASARIGEHLTGQRSQPERIIEFAIGEQSRIGGDDGAAKLRVRRRSKSSRRAPNSASPVGFAIAASAIPDKLLIAIGLKTFAQPAPEAIW